ncbi:MAG: hypothetical protein K0S07_1395, partial [Chlamydiales bacterium]|nr:hypothetical protein [Chlamydiales bacterium]
LLLKKFQGDPKRLALSLTQAATQREPLYQLPKRRQLDVHLKSKVEGIKKIIQGQGEAILFDGEARLKEALKGTRLRSQKELAALQQLLQLLQDPDALATSEALGSLEPSLASFSSKCKGKLEELESPLGFLFKFLSHDLFPFLKTYYSLESIFFRLACRLQERFQTVLEREEMLLPDDLLKKLLLAAEKKEARDYIKERYRAVIIDEFQDTDPIQWSIFKKVFLEEEWNGRIYLVGDPKQSIYRFRGADIYTYLSAIDHLGREAMATLSVNYRADPEMIEALNALFHPESLQGFFSLPRQGRALKISPLSSGGRTEPLSLNDGKGSIHLIDALPPKSAQYGLLKPLEENLFFPYLAREIHHLKREGIPLSKMAILIKDRYQASRLTDYLKKCQIAAESARGRSLADSKALPGLVEILEPCLAPKKLELVRTALGGELFNWPEEEIASFNEQISQGSFQAAEVLGYFQQLGQIFKEKGFASFFEALLYGKSLSSEPLFLSLLKRAEGKDLIDDLEHIATLLQNVEKEQDPSMESLLTFLKEMPLLDPDDSRLKCPKDPASAAVQVMTIHASKGLEFAVVFNLAVGERASLKGFKAEQWGLSLLDQDAAQRQLITDEEESEKMRLFYVAATRAKHRLYLPLIRINTILSPSLGEASSMEIFLAYFGRPAPKNQEDLYRRLDSQLSDPFLNHLPPSITLEKVAHLPPYEPQEEAKELAPLHFTPILAVKKEQVHTASFSSRLMLQQKKELEYRPVSFEDMPSASAIPSSKKFGLFFHELMKLLSPELIRALKYADAPPAQLLDFITSFAAASPFKEYVPSIAELVLNTVTTPLLEGSSFCLADVDFHKAFREMEFLCPQEDAFYKGVIDLVFPYNERYYLVDYKTNLLGPTLNHYQKDSLLREIHSGSYDLQQSIYLKAISAYFRHWQQGPNALAYGGSLYLFVRGMHPSRGPECGIYPFF